MNDVTNDLLDALKLVTNDLACLIEESGKDASKDRRIKIARSAISSAEAALAEMKPIHANGNREMTMKGRNFTADKDGFISDNNFDFDAGLKVAGDFVGDEKQGYAKMIAASLNKISEATIASAHIGDTTSKAARLTEEDIVGIRKTLSGWDCSRPWSQTIALSRAIESAVLRKNGIEVME